MKTLVDLLRTHARWAVTHDDDAIPGVYAAPGPRAQGDEATSEPVLAATLLDDLDTYARSPPDAQEAREVDPAEDPGSEPPPDGNDLN